jgi:hypothetical protein
MSNTVLHLKCNPNYYTWTPSRTKRRNQWQYWITAAVSRCYSWCTAWNGYGHIFRCPVARWALVTDKHFLCPKILWPVGVLSHSVLPCQDTHCQMLHKQQQTTLMLSNIRECTQVLLVNTQCLHLHTFCATSVSSGLATRVTLTSVTGEVRKSKKTWMDLHFCTVVREFLGCSKWNTLYNVWYACMVGIKSQNR